ncbi:hypothetical protein NPIL_198781 [Nephila pilipes]|uniref:Ig-like domain-containing protein n=1 Tax=Nephila pilipes TaxID=299642 RepID=A0A8X6UTV9_NEPPI|nr:hypothetical protein NPIL_198781 [Nephila pilipes]
MDVGLDMKWGYYRPLSLFHFGLPRWVITTDIKWDVKIEPHASTLPRVTFSQPQVRTEEGSFTQLPCVAQGNPPPTYR